MKRILSSIIAVAAVALTACGGTSQSGSQADARIGVKMAAGTADVASITVTVTGPGIAAPGISQELVNQAGSWSATFSRLPAGNPLDFAARAFDSNGTLLYSGSAPATPIAATTINLIIVLNEQNPTQFSNNAPMITSLFAGADAVAPGGQISLRVGASDADGDRLSYLWTPDAGAVAPNDAAQVVWTAPTLLPDNTPFTAPVTYNVVVTVNDDRGGQVLAILTVTVDPALIVGSARVTVTLNDAPAVTEMTYDQLANDAGAFTATANDLESATLTYAWSATCAGDFTGSGTAVTFTPAVPVGTMCSVQVLVADGNGGTNAGTLTFQVGFPAVVVVP